MGPERLNSAILRVFQALIPGIRQIYNVVASRGFPTGRVCTVPAVCNDYHVLIGVGTRFWPLICLAVLNVDDPLFSSGQEYLVFV